MTVHLSIYVMEDDNNNVKKKTLTKNKIKIRLSGVWNVAKTRTREEEEDATQGGRGEEVELGPQLHSSAFFTEVVVGWL